MGLEVSRNCLNVEITPTLTAVEKRGLRVAVKEGTGGKLINQNDMSNERTHR